MSDGAEQSASSSPGARLAGVRQRAGLTLMQAAERLHLDTATLQALESGRFESLGAAVFVRGHLRRYAEMLGVPATEIDSAYAASECGVAPLPDLRRTATPLASARARGVALRPHSALIGTIVVVLLGLVWWAMRVPSAARRPAAGPSAARAMPPVARPPNVAEPASHPAMPAAAMPAASTSAASRSTAGHVRLGLKFTQDSWAEVYDADGSRLLYGLGAAGSDRHLAGAAPLQILLGNPEGVDLELDGRAVPLAAAGRSSPMRFSLNGAGRVVPSRSSPPGASAQPRPQPQP